MLRRSQPDNPEAPSDPARLPPIQPPSGGDPAAVLTEYEAEQVRQIAAWKAEKSGLRSGLFNDVEKAAARFAERFIPSRVAQDAINKVYEEAERTANRGDVERQAGVKDLGELRHRPLEVCDKLAHGVGVWAQGLAVAGGAATGAGGFFTSALDVPLLLTLALRTIIKVGHCYGYALDRKKDERFVLGILMVAATDDPEKKRELLGRLREVEEWMLEESEEELVEDEALDLLLQLEIFDDIPGLGAITAGLENYAFVHHAANASKRVFQERWLHNNGKLDAVEPSAAVAAAGADGSIPRWLYKSAYYVGFGAALPACVVAHAFAPSGGPVPVRPS